MSEPIRRIQVSDSANLHNSLTQKPVEVSQQQIKELLVQTLKKRFPAPVPKPLTQQQRFQQYSNVLSKLDPSKIIRIIPDPTVTLTPIQPRDSYGKVP